MYNTLDTCKNVFLTGPAKSLFEKPYFEKMKAALRPGGLICSMGKQDIVGGCGLCHSTFAVYCKGWK